MFTSIQAARFALAAACLLASNLGSANADLTIADRPWLDKSQPAEERLQLFMLQLNTTQKYAMVQGDTVVCSPTLNLNFLSSHKTTTAR